MYAVHILHVSATVAAAALQLLPGLQLLLCELQTDSLLLLLLLAPLQPLLVLQHGY
jgi:hypothetical protein